AALDDPRDNIGALHPLDLEGELAVVDQDGVAWAHVGGEAAVRGGAALSIAADLLGRDGELIALMQMDRALVEGTEPDLRALQVDEHTDVPAGQRRSRPHPPVPLLVLFVAAVAQVEARDIHACRDQLAKPFGRICSRPEGAHNLRSTHVYSV